MSKLPKQNEGFSILNITERTLSSVRETKFEDSELIYIDANKFRDCSNDGEKYLMVKSASSNIPPEARLSVATQQINYLADQVNRAIQLKILYNNLLDKFTEQVNRNNDLMKIVEKEYPDKVKVLEMQLEKLSTESEIKKNNSEKRKLKTNPKIDKNLLVKYAFIHGNYYFNLPININNLLINKLIRLFINFIFSC
jgi:hypothetical protein